MHVFAGFYLEPYHFVQVTLNRICAVLSPVEFGALEQGGAKMAALTPEELKKMKDDGR